MNPTSDTPTGRRSWKNRTSLVTAAAVAGVLIAGTAAVAANMGILDAADDSAIGDLAATDELLPTTGAATDTSPPVTVTDVTAPPTTTAAGPTVQQYDIEATGTVWVATTRSGIALDHVGTTEGWTAALAQNDLRSLQVVFTNADRTVVFTAALADDGTVLVDVTEPTTVYAADPGAAPAASSSPGAPAPAASQQYDDDDDDDHEYEDDDHEDDDHEYEGADDDD